MSAVDPLYSELQHKEIRVLKIAPGEWHDEIECELLPVPLHNTFVFDALSYAWGSSKLVRSIILNGRAHSVTASAHQALRRLRQTYDPTTVTVWIDALCINQSDDKERANQVQLMREIYTKARQVIIYLGEVQNSKSKVSSKSTFFQPKADDGILSSFVARCSLQNVPKIPKMDEASEVFCLIHSIAEAQNLDDIALFGADSKYHRRLFEALRQLMRCRWWDRMWTLQEAVVPRDVIIIYGPCVSTWDMFTRAAKAYSDRKPSEAFSLLPPEYLKVIDFYSQIVLGIENMRRRWTSNEQTTLLSLLRQFSGRNATDPRDRVYALLGLARGRLPVQPNYSIDVATVYQRTVLGIISSTGALSVLNGDTGRKLRQDLPSWVPDWTAEYHDLDRHRAETAHHYATTLQSSVYVESMTFKDLRGIEDVLEHMWTEKHGTDNPIPLLWSVEDYTMVLGTSHWTDYLPSQADDPDENLAAPLEAIEKYVTFQCDTVCLREYGDGTISLPGLNLKEIVTVGAVNMAETDLIPTIQSWGLLAAKQIGNVMGWHAFMRTLCADIIYPSDRSVSACRRVRPEDLKAIAHWLIHQSNSPFGEREVAKNHGLLPIRRGIENYFPEDESSREFYATLDVKRSVFLATSRRAFFTTNEGGLGLGPPQISPGDRVYALLGAKTPFILRSAGAGRILQKLEIPSSESPAYPRFKVIGDCFLHGAMDGEEMKFWREASSATIKTPISFQQHFQRLEQLKQAICDLEDHLALQRELEGTFSRPDEDGPICTFTQLSRNLRLKPLSIEELDLLSCLIRDENRVDERRVMEVFHKFENIKKPLAMPTVSEDHGIIYTSIESESQIVTAQLRQIIREKEMDIDAKKVILVRSIQELALKLPYVFLV